MAKEIVAGAKLPASATRLLDLGGSHGMYSILFCKHHPALHATVMDWGMAKPVAEANIASEGLEDRVVFEEGDFLEDDLPRGLDAILMFNIIRILTPEELCGFLSKAQASLAPGGVLLVMDHLGKEPRTPFVKANSDLILLELYNSTQGRTHRAEAVTRSLLDLGFAEAKTISLMRSPGLGMIRAIKG